MTSVLFVELNRKLYITYFMSAFSLLNLIWTDFTSFWYLVSCERVDLTLQEVLLGKLDTEMNYCIILLRLLNYIFW